MKNTRFIAVFALVIVLLASAWAFAADGAPKPDAAVQKITIPTIVAPKETRSYKVDVAMKGRMPAIDSSGPTDLDAAYSLSVKHAYGQREGDGLLPLYISVADTEATTNGEKLAVSPSLFPKLTLLIDNKWNITNLFGTSGTSYAVPKPGINYANMVMLFFLPDADKPHAVGESWQNKVKLPGFPDIYNFSTTLKSLGEVNGIKVAVVHQEITWNPQKLENGLTAASKASTDSTYSLDKGMLVKSTVLSNIRFSNSANSTSGGQESAQDQANIKIDISLAK